MTYPGTFFGWLRDQRGTMAIETALIAPLLATLALGVFEVSRIVGREQQLQSAANEASEIILAAAGGSGIDSGDLGEILKTSLNLGDDQLAIEPRYRCGTQSNLSATVPGCASGQQLYSYVQLTVTDTYSPMWTNFGVGSPIDYSVVRTVQIS